MVSGTSVNEIGKLPCESKQRTVRNKLDMNENVFQFFSYAYRILFLLRLVYHGVVIVHPIILNLLVDLFAKTETDNH